MKTKINPLAIMIILIVSIVLSSCSHTKEIVAYQCPMKCEKEKTYEQAGKCPVCKMSLKGVEASKHNHD
jgi:protein SCO1/2